MGCSTHMSDLHIGETVLPRHAQDTVRIVHHAHFKPIDALPGAADAVRPLDLQPEIRCANCAKSAERALATKRIHAGLSTASPPNE